MTNTMTDLQKIDLVRVMLEALEEAVAAAGDHGAPGGVLYAALMTHVPSMTATQFENLMGILVKAGRVTRRGQLYFAAKPKQDVCERCGIVKTSGHMCGSCGEDV